jgi:hypothetical protein
MTYLQQNLLLQATPQECRVSFFKFLVACLIYFTEDKAFQTDSIELEKNHEEPQATTSTVHETGMYYELSSTKCLSF